MEDREEHVYTCKAPSCGDPFVKATPSWFAGKGLSEPKFCPDCKEWIDDQEGSETVSCSACGYSWGAAAKYRIIYLKKIGDWDEDKDSFLCRRCEKDPMRVLKQKMLRATNYLKKMAGRVDVDLVEQAFADEVDAALELIKNESASSRTSFEVPTDVDFYERTKLYSRHKLVVKNQVEHFLKGKDGKQDHQWKEKLGTDDPKVIIQFAAAVAALTGDSIAEKKQANGNIMKCDARTGVVVIVKPDTASETGYSIETAFMPEDGIESYLGSKLKVDL